METLYKLLVNAPSGVQEIHEVTESGSYFDASRVVWDERVDGPMPDVAVGTVVRVIVDGSPELHADATLQASQAVAALASAQADALLAVDVAVDKIVAEVVGSRTAEYTQAEADAAAYKAAGYAGTVPAYVADWLAVMGPAQGWSAKQCADDILTTAAGWRQAQAAMRGHRLQTKQAIRSATTASAVGTSMAAWNGFINTMRAMLGLTGST